MAGPENPFEAPPSDLGYGRDAGPRASPDPEIGSVVVRYVWTAEELNRAYDWHFRGMCRPAIRVVIHLFAGLSLLFGLMVFIAGGPTPLAVCGVLFGLFWFVLAGLLRRHLVARQFQGRPDRDLEVEWEFTSEWVRSRTSLSFSEVSWRTFAKATTTPEGILLYSNPQVYHWLPRNAFSSPAEFARVDSLVRENIPRHQEAA